MKEIVAWFSKNLKPEHIFVDIGAHIGGVFVPVVWEVKPRWAIAFEPTPVSFDYLKKNCEEFLTTDYELQNKAVLDKTGEAEMYEASWGSPSNTFLDRFEGKNNAKFKVETTALDDIEFNGRLMIKMDAELSEPKIWKGMKKTLPKVDAIVMEIFAEAFGNIGVDITPFLDEIRQDGFEIFDLDEKLFSNEAVIKAKRTDIIIRLK